MNIGIFFGYSPTTDLKKEGLGRYIGHLIDGFIKSGQKVTIATPEWLLPSLQDLFDDFNINEDSLDFIISYKTPVALTLYNRFFKKKKKKRKSHRLIKTIADLINFGINVILKTSNWIIFTFIALFSVAVIIALIPLALILGIVGILSLILYFFIRKTTKKEGRIRVKLAEFKQIFLERLKNAAGRGADFYINMLDNLNHHVLGDLVRKINRNDTVDVWYVPSIFWKEPSNIETITIYNVPDLVTIVFPSLFAYNATFANTSKIYSKIIENAKYFVTYSDYIKDTVVIETFGKKSENVLSIPHINNNLLDYIKIDESLNKKLNTTKDFTKAFARSSLRFLFQNRPSDDAYIRGFDFENTEYIFYSSQARPHKNLLNLVKAYHVLLREKNYSIKLFLTCDFNHAPDVLKYILKHRLQYDVLGFYNIPTQLLASVYHCAKLVVNPSLYEGGFPFTFGEGMSVGTPSVMGRIPQNEAVLLPYKLDHLMFDPYDYRDIAKVIGFALDNIEQVYSDELHLYSRLSKRTSDMVAKEYVEAFQYFIDLDSKYLK